MVKIQPLHFSRGLPLFAPKTERRDGLPLTAKISKSLIAPARHNNGPTLYLICSADQPDHCVIYEQMPNGTCQAWPEALVGGVQQAECMIYQRASERMSICPRFLHQHDETQVGWPLVPLKFLQGLVVDFILALFTRFHQCVSSILITNIYRRDCPVLQILF